MTLKDVFRGLEFTGNMMVSPKKSKIRAFSSNMQA
jgi:hypothetical protein